MRIESINMNKDQELRFKKLMNHYKKMEKEEKNFINELKV